MPVEHSSEMVKLTLEPVRQSDGRVLGAVSVSGPTSRLKGEIFTTTLPEQVMEAANIIELNIETTSN
jgi:DNA-binding IclR family transcriptional regulator